ncbi:FAD-dependent monooxygenase ctb5 [Vermiconidia calcicola]|uniref:FAD-dependent monooxygenase ctb5 n=1 Tax=Vermiconidia calcicola TaxID=1690605 RepID=A0ACC3NC87_9PEZI|nr:FAD-dependent monooxygenase ctb5 [Vermiconidia calcicola]
MLGLNFQQWILSLPRVAPYVGGSTQHHHIASGSPWAAVASSSSCCEALSNSLGSDSVVFPDDAAYPSTIGSFFSSRNHDLHPSCVAFPKSAQDVSTAVQVLSLGAQVWSGKCQFGIRGGGHTPFKGAANIDGGIVLDTLHLPSSGLSPNHETITVSPSTTWDQVYEGLAEKNRSTLGTKVAGVGVGGAATSCGVSYFSPRHGFICDMVENFEVVLATGDVVNANIKENPRLWKALRGGSNNFGVVTALTLRTFEQGVFWGGQTFHDIDTRKQHFRTVEQITNSHPFDPYAHFVTSLVMTNMTRDWFVANSLQYTKSNPPMPEPKVFKPFLDVPQTPPFPGAPPNTLRVDDVTGYSREFAAPLTYPKRWSFATISFAPNAGFMEQFFQMANDAMQTFFDLPGFVLALNYQAIPTVQSERHRGLDSLGPVHTEGNMVFIHWTLGFDQSEVDSEDAIQQVVQQLFEDANEKAKSMNVHRNYIQHTYAEQWQNPYDSRSKGTVRDLLETSRMYDPLQVFQKQVPGGFKLPQL